MDYTKFPSIKELYLNETLKDNKDNKFFVFEKVDGSNVSIRKGYRNSVVPWSRGAPIKKSEKYFFNKFRSYLYTTLSPQIYDLPEDIIIFGEFTHNGFGHIPYNLRNVGKFLMIAMYNTNNRKFLMPEESAEWLQLMGLENEINSVPLLSKGKVSPQIVKDCLKDSKLYSGIPEGVVIHHYNKNFPDGVQFLKKYNPEFKEIDESKEGIEKYITQRRFTKVAQNLSSSGVNELNISSILNGTLKDIIRETDMHSNSTIKKLRYKLANYSEMIRFNILPLFNNDN